MYLNYKYVFAYIFEDLLLIYHYDDDEYSRPLQGQDKY